MLSLFGGTTTIFPGRQSGETMIVVYHENRKVVQLFWDDLSPSAKERLLELLGDNGNYDVFPLAELVIENETDENREENEKCPQ